MVLGLGCTSPEPAVPGGEALTLEAFDALRGDAACLGSRLCAEPFAHRESACDGFRAPDARVELARRGVLRYDEVIGGACLHALATRCDVDPSGGTWASERPCDEAFSATVLRRVGEACTDHLECGSGAYCGESPACGAGTVCISRGWNGDACTSDRACQDEHDGAPQHCIYDRCTVLLDGFASEVGAQCGPIGAGTGDGLTYSVTPACQGALVCEAARELGGVGTCVPLADRGAACGPGVAACGPNIRCVSGRCDTRIALSLGGLCNERSDRCGPGLRCSGSSCVAWRSRLGEGCDEEAPCAEGLTCRDTICVRSGPRLGQPCSEGCAEGTCEGGTCTRIDRCITPLPPADLSCASGWPETPSFTARLACDATGPVVRIQMTPTPIGCDAAPEGSYYEMTGRGDSLEPSEITVWYDDASSTTNDVRFCTGPDFCSGIVSSRWSLERSADGTSAPILLSIVDFACMNARSELATLMRGGAVEICGPTTITCP